MDFYIPQIQTNEAIQAQLQQQGKQILFLTADWCRECKAIKPFVGEFRNIIEKKGLNWIDVDRDANLEIAKAQNLRGMPVFVLIEHGKQVDHFGSGELLNPREVADWLVAV